MPIASAKIYGVKTHPGSVPYSPTDAEFDLSLSTFPVPAKSRRPRQVDNSAPAAKFADIHRERVLGLPNILSLWGFLIFTVASPAMY